MNWTIILIWFSAGIILGVIMGYARGVWTGMSRTTDMFYDIIMSAAPEAFDKINAVFTRRRSGHDS